MRVGIDGTTRAVLHEFDRDQRGRAGAVRLLVDTGNHARPAEHPPAQKPRTCELRIERQINDIDRKLRAIAQEIKTVPASGTDAVALGRGAGMQVGQRLVVARRLLSAGGSDLRLSYWHHQGRVYRARACLAALLSIESAADLAAEPKMQSIQICAETARSVVRADVS
jgi:hypothetical protein